MTTITFEEEVKFKKNNFSSVNDFLLFLANNKDYYVEFWSLKDNEITEDLRELYNKSKSWKINFVNI